MKQVIRPTPLEIEFLTLSYNRFYDIFDEVMADNFFDKDSWYRFSRIKDAFAIYAELLNYEPIKWIIEHLKKARPPMEAKIGSELFKFIRNVITHFPFFDKWDDVWINKSIINWYQIGQTIDKFLERYKGHETIKYRFWEAEKKRMTYLSITFPKQYNNTTKIFLNDFLTEREGVKFSLILMRQIINTQVEKEIQKEKIQKNKNLSI